MLLLLCSSPDCGLALLQLSCCLATEFFFCCLKPAYHHITHSPDSNRFLCQTSIFFCRMSTKGRKHLSSRRWVGMIDIASNAAASASTQHAVLGCFDLYRIMFSVYTTDATSKSMININGIAIQHRAFSSNLMPQMTLC